jgi:hypothetical protein
MSSPERLERVAAALRDAGDGPPPGAVQEALCAAVSLYAEAAKRDGAFSALPASGRPPATDVLITVSALLEAVDVEVFELGMWKAWGTYGGEPR